MVAQTMEETEIDSIVWNAFDYNHIDDLYTKKAATGLIENNLSIGGSALRELHLDLGKELPTLEDMKKDVPPDLSSKFSSVTFC